MSSSGARDEMHEKTMETILGDIPFLCVFGASEDGGAR
jgi:hypothetical protein